ncbi:thioesterase family protein [Paenibacillus sp. R14(2021)]|uniref:acyl-CoA thioesterase n=1 Tax=Paenibacillus sp. R14(2021) TaxID=2859228 RepID=UPI001C615BFD|nr:thioesterase family protein [Paenibacillus sp. R14(2021)]
MTEEAGSKTLWHLHPLRVRYQENDGMGVVFYGNYVNWFEIGRTEIVRALGMSYASIEKQGMLLPVIDLDCKYVSPARYDDCVLVCTTIEDFSPIRMSFRSEVRLIEEGEVFPTFWQRAEPPGKLLVKGGTRHVWVNRDWKPSRLDKAIPELYELLQSAATGALPVPKERF